MDNFQANLRKLPGISHLTGLRLLAPDGEEVGWIENKSGSQGALAVYNHVAQIYGAITPDAARKALELFAEHCEDARANPGRHPNIDRLFVLIAENRTLRVKHVFAV